MAELHERGILAFVSAHISFSFPFFAAAHFRELLTVFVTKAWDIFSPFSLEEVFLLSEVVALASYAAHKDSLFTSPKEWHSQKNTRGGSSVTMMTRDNDGRRKDNEERKKKLTYCIAMDIGSPDLMTQKLAGFITVLLVSLLHWRHLAEWPKREFL